VSRAVEETGVHVAALPSLRREPLEVRALRSLLLSGLTWAAALVASVPLVFVLYRLIERGSVRLGWATLS